MGRIPQLCRDTLKDPTKLSKTILWLIVAAMYEFRGKPEKLKKTKPWITIEDKKNDNNFA